MKTEANPGGPVERIVSLHTPGPWTLRRHGVVVGGEFHKYTNGAAQSQLAMVTVLQASEAPDPVAERDANAQLIATAPELLEALRGALLVMRDEALPRKQDAIAAAEAAVAKALGMQANTHSPTPSTD